MRTIFKYPLAYPLGERQTTLQLPKGAIVLHAGYDGPGALCLWAHVPETEAPKAPRTFVVFGTGFEIPEGLSIRYVGTVHEPPHGTFVWHIYEALQ